VRDSVSEGVDDSLRLNARYGRVMTYIGSIVLEHDSGQG
jgi:hypothetical protein